MQNIILYRYERENGGVTISPVKPEAEYTEMFRLIADEGKALTQDGVNLFPCVDVSAIDGWYEVDDKQEEATEEDYLAALAEMGVEV